MSEQKILGTLQVKFGLVCFPYAKIALPNGFTRFTLRKKQSLLYGLSNAFFPRFFHFEPVVSNISAFKRTNKRLLKS